MAERLTGIDGSNLTNPTKDPSIHPNPHPQSPGETLSLLSLLALLTLAPLLALGVRFKRAKKAPSIPLARQDEPTPARINALMREFKSDRESVHHTVRGLTRYLAPEDALTIARCADVPLRWSTPGEAQEVLRVRQCKSLWCPWCVRKQHWRRTKFQHAKVQSIQPAGDDQVRLLNIVAELPVALHALVRHDATCMDAWVDAIKLTIAQAYGYKGRKGASATRACWSELGAVLNFHAIGDEGEPFPKWFPHWDILLSAYRLKNGKIERLRTTWPEPFEHTRNRYRANLRAAFLPIVSEGAHADLDLVELLQADFDVIWHVSRPPKGAGPGHVHVRSAMHRIRYSCRPLFGLDRCRLEKDDRGDDVLVYDPNPNARKRSVHRAAPGPAFGALRDLRDHLHGKRARRVVGILVGKAYTKAVEIAGRKPVAEREKARHKLTAAYLPDGHGGWTRVDPSQLRRY